MKTHIRVYLLIFSLLYTADAYGGVNPDGSFSQSIPIEIPPSRQGLQPQLALSYNSNSPNGIVGIGWSLQGLPSITRMNYGSGITYSGTDTFVGPEGRLISVSIGIYHAENETWSKYEALGSDDLALNSGNKCGNSVEPCQWRVTDRNGTQFYYGLTANSRIVAKDAANNDINNGAVRVWALEKVKDLHGNYYEITYKKDSGVFSDSGQYYPEKISYALGNGSSKNYAVSFFYDESGRPDKNIVSL